MGRQIGSKFQLDLQSTEGCKENSFGKITIKINVTSVLMWVRNKSRMEDKTIYTHS